MAKRKDLKTGIKAPAFSLKDQDDATVKLADLKGQWTVLYFYPKDNTPGCTTEGQDFSKLLPKFKKAGATLFGISADTTEKHRKFINKCSLKVSLLSDPDHKMIGAYGAWGEKKFMGRTFDGIIRSTLIIDPKGKIAHYWPTVRVKGHAQEVLETLQSLA